MNPVIIEDQITIAANTVVDNVINSNSSLIQYLRVPFNCRCLFAGVISATGVRVDVSIGSVNAVSEADLRVGTDLQIPLDVLNDKFFGEKGKIIIVRASNTTVAGITLRYKIVLAPWMGELPASRLTMQRGPVAVAINAIDFQLLSGLRYERTPFNAVMTLLMTAAATGVTRKVNVDMEAVAPPQAVAPLNRVPQDPFDTVLSDIEILTDKLIQIPVSNPTAGAINVNWRIYLDPV